MGSEGLWSLKLLQTGRSGSWLHDRAPGCIRSGRRNWFRVIGMAQERRKPWPVRPAIQSRMKVRLQTWAARLARAGWPAAAGAEEMGRRSSGASASGIRRALEGPVFMVSGA